MWDLELEITEFFEKKYCERRSTIKITITATVKYRSIAIKIWQMRVMLRQANNIPEGKEGFGSKIFPRELGSHEEYQSSGIDIRWSASYDQYNKETQEVKAWALHGLSSL
ncbi:MAG: hypothetical protein C4549_07515 [Deltaproteobacteria bacterium]|nr:MAG: hypothetical protein C4549_07515 [Deltaproteobacteria bacterium]